jgi:hypothetical protein
MADGRPAAVWGLVAAHAGGLGHAVSIADVCAVAARSAHASGAWVAAAPDRGPVFVMCVTGPACEQLADLHVLLGEGPCHDVLTSAAPVLAADLSDREFSRRWPAFTPEARRLGAGALFAFPLMIGAIRAGVMGLYRTTPGPLPGEGLGDCLILADAATILLLGSVDGKTTADGAGTAGQSPDLALHRAEIDQATGMITIQLGVPAAEAFARLRAYAYSQDRRLTDVAGDIVARRLRLHPDPAQDGSS